VRAVRGAAGRGPASPRVVIAAPVFENAAYLPAAVESLLAQTYGDFALLLIDDRSSDDTAAVCERYARADPRVVAHVNERRLGMLGNTREAFRLARRLYPDAEYWALGSDHDVWEPRWLETLVGLLDAHAEAVLAYGGIRRIDGDGRPYAGAKPPWRFETAGLDEPRARLRTAYRGMVAGDMIYGLFRAAALDGVGPYQAVLVPDRLLLCELALRGQFLQADAVLWNRRFRGLADLDRQRRAFWPEGAPGHAALPWWLTHAGVFAWRYAVLGKGADAGIGRAEGAALALDYLEVSVRHRMWRRGRQLRRRARRARRRTTATVVETRDGLLGPPVRAALRRPRARRATVRHVLPRLRALEETRERLTAEPGARPAAQRTDAAAWPAPATSAASRSRNGVPSSSTQ
jgi:glycosyltransferase involved in cell wall biosynthesis